MVNLRQQKTHIKKHKTHIKSINNRLKFIFSHKNWQIKSTKTSKKPKSNYKHI